MIYAKRRKMKDKTCEVWMRNAWLKSKHIQLQWWRTNIALEAQKQDGLWWVLKIILLPGVKHEKITDPLQPDDTMFAKKEYLMLKGVVA